MNFPLLLPRLVLASIIFVPLLASASRFVEVRPVDESILMVFFRDGEVRFKDDGTGESAFKGHAYAPGDDRMVRFGEPLDTEVAKGPTSWVLTSGDDEAYADDGENPSAVHRKAKVFHTTAQWEYALDHTIFLRLPTPLQEGATYTLRIDPAMQSDRTEVTFTYTLATAWSEAIHVNLLGYTPDSPIKAADLYLWLGDGGPRDYRAFEGNAVWMLDEETGKRHRVGEVEFWKPLITEAYDRSLTGSPVWKADFSSWDQPGRYRLMIEGVGVSAPFDIRADHWFEPFKTSVRGYYYMRIGEPVDAADPPPRQPRFIPEEDPAGFTIYLTDLDPFDPEWDEHPGDTWDEMHFKPTKESMFWKRRLPGNPTTDIAIGGHSDALDWDRHLGHVSNIYDLLLPYLLSNGKLDDDDLDIAESGNGIPDLIDEARNEVDLWLNLRVGDAYAHGLTNPTGDHTAMFQAGVTNMAAWANAANAAILAEAFRISGHDELMRHYRDEAIKAYEFASIDPEHLDEVQEIGNGAMRGRDFRMMAAAFLYNVTGDTVWEDRMAADSLARDGVALIEKAGEWAQTWGTAAYLFTPREQNHPALAANMRRSIRQQALEQNVSLMDVRPSRRSSINLWWQTAHNLHLVILAHAFAAEDEPESERLERAMILEADWGLGRNPTNTVEMTGLGSRCIVNCYTSGRNDGVPGLHPGHTPYNNIHPWGGTHNGSNPMWFAERGYPAWEDGWPHQEAHFNSRYSWANGEFTPRQTMRGKMALYGYLYYLNRGD